MATMKSNDCRVLSPRNPIRVSVSDHIEWFYNWFASIGISRVWLSRDENGCLEKCHIHSWRLILFILLRCNLVLKVVYLVYILIIPSAGEPLDVLSTLGISIWIVLAGVAAYSDYYFAQIYPAFEVFCGFWNVQSDIYESLNGKANRDFKKELNRSAKVRTMFHTYVK